MVASADSGQSRTSSDRAAATQARYILAVLTLANVSGLVDRQVVALLVEPLKRDLLVSDTHVSLLMGFSFALFYSVMGLPAGMLVDRYPRRLVVAAGAALWSGMTFWRHRACARFGRSICPPAATN